MSNMMRFNHLANGSLPIIETDRNIPVTICWEEPSPTEGFFPLYIRVSGTCGGELELTFDRLSGRLWRIIILEIGPTAQAASVPVPATEEPGGDLVMDTALWAEQPNLHVIDVELPLRSSRLENGFRIDVDGAESKSVVNCGPLLTIGLDTDRTLASITSTLPISEDHFRS